ncbi:hypothetical protein GGR56DRAFT_686942 [Xylariaceae sp. FL0804]|nr:hypothetical protein GGR56DRAFT_686942 [Xylariaceae sp. FL0804]
MSSDQEMSGGNNGPELDSQRRQRWQITTNAEAEKAERERPTIPPAPLQQWINAGTAHRQHLEDDRRSPSQSQGPLVPRGAGEVDPSLPMGGLTVMPRHAVKQVWRGGHARALINKNDPGNSTNIVQMGPNWNMSQTQGPEMLRQATEVAIDNLGVKNNTVVLTSHAVVPTRLQGFRSIAARHDAAVALRAAAGSSRPTGWARAGGRGSSSRGGGRGSSSRGGSRDSFTRGGGRGSSFRGSSSRGGGRGGERGGGGFRGGRRGRQQRRHHPYGREEEQGKQEKQKEPAEKGIDERFDDFKNGPPLSPLNDSGEINPLMDISD